MNKNMILNNFGNTLIKDVYDNGIERYKKILSGNVKAPSLIRLHDKLEKELIINNSDTFDRFEQECLTSILHHFLWMIEQSDEFDLIAKTDEGDISLKEISDGLCGELYSDEGWISKYSAYPNLLD